MPIKIDHPKITLLFLLWRRRGISITTSQLEEGIELTEMLSLLCGGAVIIGLFIEVFVTLGILEHCKLIQKLASIGSSVFVALGVAGEIYFGNLSGSLEKELRHILTTESKEKIASLEKLTADANLKAEELRAKNIEFERALAPRMLEQTKTAINLRNFSDFEVKVVSISETEPRRTAGQIRWLLINGAKWKRLAQTIPPEYLRFIPDGVTVRTIAGINSGPSIEAANALIEQLSINGIFAERGAPISPRVFGGNAIIVLVGLKPTPLFLRPKIEDLPSVAGENIFFGNTLEE